MNADNSAENSEHVLQRESECSRCKSELRYLGKRAFHQSSGLGANSYVGDYFAKKQLHVFYCTKCGHIDLFFEK